jgi:hypothetical protein
MCTQVCIKIDPKKVSEDQRLRRKFACSEILEKIGAGKNVLKTYHLPCKLTFQYDPNKASVHTMENSCCSKTTKLNCEPRILRISCNIVTRQDSERQTSCVELRWQQDSAVVHKPIFVHQFSALANIMLQDVWHSPDLALKGTHFKSVANTHKTGLHPNPLPIQCIFVKMARV